MERQKTKKILWGLLLLAAAVLILVGKLTDFPAVGVLILLVLGAIVISGILHKNFAMILFPIAIFIILYDEQLRLTAITPWPVLGAALLGSIGLSVLFPGKAHWCECRCDDKHWHEGSGMAQESAQEFLDGEEVRLENTFGETIKYISSTELSQVRLENSFGSLVVYLNNAVLKNNIADVRVECSFGTIVLYVPASWKTRLNVKQAFGGVDEKGACNPDSEITLQIWGEVSFGAIEIRYI